MPQIYRPSHFFFLLLCVKIFFFFLLSSSFLFSGGAQLCQFFTFRCFVGVRLFKQMLRQPRELGDQAFLKEILKGCFITPEESAGLLSQLQQKALMCQVLKYFVLFPFISLCNQHCPVLGSLKRNIEQMQFVENLLLFAPCSAVLIYLDLR